MTWDKKTLSLPILCASPYPSDALLHHIAESMKNIVNLYSPINCEYHHTGSAEAQIALFSYRISHLTEHLKLNRKDYSTERALTTLVGKRRALLNYLKNRDIERYRAIVKALGLRK